MDQIYDKSPSGCLDQFEKWRRHRMNYLYLCKKCRRSFDSKAEKKFCKFCSGEIIQLMHVDRLEKNIMQKTKPRFQYVCSVCDTLFDSEEPVNACPVCRTKWLHTYKWGDLSTSDKFHAKFMGAIKNLVRKNEAHRTSLHHAVREHNKAAGAKKGRKPVRFDFRLKRRSDEEMPSY